MFVIKFILLSLQSEYFINKNIRYFFCNYEFSLYFKIKLYYYGYKEIDYLSNMFNSEYFY